MRPHFTTRAFAGLGCGVLAIAFAACGSASDGDLVGFGDQPTANCILTQGASVFLLGDMIRPREAITVTRVDLRGEEASGLSVEGVYLLDPTAGDPYASWAGVPERSPAWDQRVDAVGRSLKAGETWNLVVEVALVDPKAARVDALQVGYEANGKEAVETGPTSYEISDECGGPG